MKSVSLLRIIFCLLEDNIFYKHSIRLDKPLWLKLQSAFPVSQFSTTLFFFFWKYNQFHDPKVGATYPNQDQTGQAKLSSLWAKIMRSLGTPHNLCQHRTGLYNRHTTWLGHRGGVGHYPLTFSLSDVLDKKMA